MIEKILRHLKLWPEHAESARLSRAPPSGNSERNVEPYFDDLPAVSATQSLQAGPFPACHGVAERRLDYDTEPVMAYANDPEFAA